MFPAIEFSLAGSLRIIAVCAIIVLFVLLPVTGWVAESWLGRYPAILVGMLMSTVAALFFQVVFVLLQHDWTSVPALVLSVVGSVIGVLDVGSLYTNMLPFTLDQMIGALYFNTLTVTTPGHCPGGLTCVGFSVLDQLRLHAVPMRGHNAQSTARQ